MHLKNWSLIYREAGDKPQLAPVYDAHSTVPYIPADAMALSLAGRWSFKGMNVQRWKAFANRAPAGLPEREAVPAKVF
ncbi:serine/threonine protein kinase HipA of HipAB toxin-antitoxin module [Rhizobium sp. BK181]|nr:serine/threonine protein kinase HipA of HipAB toxin-antitoxin module [Rhizobium sp. BK181]